MTDQPTLLRSEAFTEIGLLIQRDATIIVDRWGRRAQEEQPHGRRAHHSTLLDHLPSFLYELGKSLCEHGNGEVNHHCQPARTHGEQRWDAGWSLTEVVRDYQILRLILWDYLEEMLDRPLESREQKAIGLELDESIAASVSTYVESQEEYSRQVEKERADRAKEAADILSRHAAQLRETHRAKDEFLAILSHELRNPLAPLRNALHVLSMDGSAETVTWARALMDRQVQLMTRLVDDLLDVSRVARGKITLQRERLDLARIVRETTEDRRGSMAEAGIELGIDVPDGSAWIEGDATRIAQALGNLLHNAQKFSDRGGRVNIALTPRAPGQVQVSVRDTGIGIEPGMLTHVFEAFMQGEHGTSRRNGGLGLGLALVKGLIELHGGRVGASSDGVGKGAQFHFTLPLADPAPDDPVVPKQDRPLRRRLHVLVVEDDRDNADSLRTLLELMGYEVGVASNGPDGITAARRSPPDVVLCDLGLPGMTGYEVAMVLRDDPMLAGSYLIALSGHGSEADQQRCREAGFHRHFIKPIDPDVLESLMAALANGLPTTKHD